MGEEHIIKAFEEINGIIEKHGLTSRDVLNISQELHSNALIGIIVDFVTTRPTNDETDKEGYDRDNAREVARPGN